MKCYQSLLSECDNVVIVMEFPPQDHDISDSSLANKLMMQKLAVNCRAVGLQVVKTNGFDQTI